MMKQLIPIFIMFTVALITISAAKESKTTTQSNFPGWYFNPNFLQLMKQYSNTNYTMKREAPSSIMGTWEIDLSPTQDSPAYLNDVKFTTMEGKMFDGAFYGIIYWRNNEYRLGENILCIYISCQHCHLIAFLMHRRKFLYALKLNETNVLMKPRLSIKK